MRLQFLLPLLAPFALVALYHHIKYATLQQPSMGSVHRARSRARGGLPGRFRKVLHSEGDATNLAAAPLSKSL